MRKEVVVGLVLMAIIVSSGIGYLTGSSKQGVVTTTTTNTSTFFTNSGTTMTTFSTVTVVSTTTVKSTLSSSANPLPFSSTVVSTLPLGGTDMALDASTKEIFVVSPGSPTVTVVSTSTDTVTGMVHLPENSTGSVATGNGVVYFPLSGNNHNIYAFDEINGSGHLIPANVVEVIYANGTIYGTGTSNVVGINATTGSTIWNASIGYGAYQLQVNPSRGVVYALGCAGSGLVCDSEISFLDASSGMIVFQDRPGSAYYATMAVDGVTGWVYVSGGGELVAYGPLGGMIYKSNPLTCGPFIGMADDTSSNQVILAPQNYSYLLFYDGTSLSLVNMYSIPGSPQFVGQNMVYSQDNGYLYALIQGAGLAVLHASEPVGHVNSTLIAPTFPNCAPV